MAGAEVVAVDDDESVVGSVAEALGQAHGGRRYRQRRTTAPRPAQADASAGRGLGSSSAWAHVRRDRQRHGVAVLREREVDEQTVAGAVDVGEQPAVVVARLGVALEPDGGARRQQRLRLARRLLAEALHRRVRVHGLGRVDADEAHRLVVAVDAGLDRVAVDHAHDRGAGRE